MWLILAATLISAGNAIIRKLFNTSSNAWLEIQWYLFAGVFMLGAGYAFLKNAHVRIDFLSTKFSARTRNWIDIIGIIVFLFPLCWLMSYYAWPLLAEKYASGETSVNAGGLIRWPVFALIPAGFGLLALQGVSELIKRVAFLTGAGSDALAHEEEEATEVPNESSHVATDAERQHG
ncbi:TRAP transporter small permease subunit [Hydrogenophaga sp. 5NK40-0174]|uniref:TRAP transporter small permease subunit n=1 Tax=Hydrogenophaga sp. 5NK40-0174 TaxID=3127649 RepID=UPI003101E4DC